MSEKLFPFWGGETILKNQNCGGRNYSKKSELLRRNYSKKSKLWWRNYSKISKLSISLDQQSKVLCSLFWLYVKLRAIQYWKQAADHLLLPHLKLFKKAKRGLKLVSLAHFLHEFWRKIFFLLYYIDWPNFIVWLLLLRKISGNMCIAIVCSPDCDVINSKIDLTFLIKPFFYMNKKSRYLEKGKSF